MYAGRQVETGGRRHLLRRRGTRTRGAARVVAALDRRADKGAVAPDHRPAAVADLPAVGVRVPSAVPVRRGPGHLRHGRARARGSSGPDHLSACHFAERVGRSQVIEAMSDRPGARPRPPDHRPARRSRSATWSRTSRSGRAVAQESARSRRCRASRSRLRPGQDPRAGGGVGLREVDHGRLRAAADRADVGDGAVRRRRPR